MSHLLMNKETIIDSFRVNLESAHPAFLTEKYFFIKHTEILLTQGS